jgi:23S rRNA (adenine2503-C2)-methyltransferase
MDMSVIPKSQDIKDLGKKQLISWLEAQNIRPFRAGQIMRWIYQRQVDDFDQMTDLRKPVRHLLRDHFTIGRLKQIDTRTSQDGSCKYLWQLADGNRIESVLIPERAHFTLCISSQVGCAQGCRFCRTAKDGLVRNLTRGEIVAQVRDMQREVTSRGSQSKRLTNVVLMGMGEPLANYAAVMGAIRTMTDGDRGLKLAARRVTLSTAGLLGKFPELSRDVKIKLAISLNATDNRTRSRLMPINRKYPIEQIMDACRKYQSTPGHRITFEYILIQGVNDTPEDAHRLVKLLRPLKAKVNLIPFNEHPGSTFRRPQPSVIDHFFKILFDHHHTVIVRHSKGQDIAAACGQLRAQKVPG